jgi:cellulase/cellobiase CelA1
VPGGCRITYAKQSEWAGGFTANVTVANTGTAPVNGWTVRFAFPGDQRITSYWNAAVTTSGANVTATNLNYNATIAGGSSTSFGFQGTWTSNNSPPTSFTLNGTACTAG